MKIDKENLLKFIRTKHPSCMEIKSYNVIDYDSEEHGFAYENLIANCVFEVPDTNIPINNLYGRKTKKLMINVKSLKDFIRGEESIKIIE